MVVHDGHAVPNEAGRYPRFLESIRLGINHVPTGRTLSTFLINCLRLPFSRSSIIHSHVVRAQIVTGQHLIFRRISAKIFRLLAVTTFHFPADFRKDFQPTPSHYLAVELPFLKSCLDIRIISYLIEQCILARSTRPIDIP
jgi:hypothetical protein